MTAHVNPSPLDQLLHFLRHDLHQAHLDHLDAPTMLALRAQFHHWALACDEAARRPKGRSLAKSAPPVPAFTLAPPRAA